MRLGLVDEIIPEPSGGAHTNHELASAFLDEALSRALTTITAMPSGQRMDARYAKWRAMGHVGLSEA